MLEVVRWTVGNQSFFPLHMFIQILNRFTFIRRSCSIHTVCNATFILDLGSLLSILATSSASIVAEPAVVVHPVEVAF